MTDREQLADRLVRQKAILDVLREADSEARVEAASLYRPGSADATPLGRVRMDKGRSSLRVVDWAAYTRWVREVCPENLIVMEQVNPALLKALERDGGEWTDPATGELSQVPGVGFTEAARRLVVTTTDVADEWAGSVLAGVLRPELAMGAVTGELS